MSNKETKTIRLRVSHSNWRFFTRGLADKLAEGWKLPQNFANKTEPYVIVLEKEVYLDYDGPELSTWNCSPIVVQLKPVELVPVVALAYKPEDVVVTLTSSATGETIVTEGFSEGDKVLLEELTDGCTEINAIAKLQLEDINNDLEEIKVVLGESSFEERPYTVEELSTWEWAEVTKLGGLLGAGVGVRDKRQARIAVLSEQKWGVPNVG